MRAAADQATPAEGNVGGPRFDGAGEAGLTRAVAIGSK